LLVPDDVEVPPFLAASELEPPPPALSFPPAPSLFVAVLLEERTPVEEL
jgi:hypothetical protein